MQPCIGHEAEIADARGLPGHEVEDVFVLGHADEDQLGLGEGRFLPAGDQMMHALAHRHMAGEERAKGPRRARPLGRAEARRIDAQRHAEDAAGLDAMLDQRALGEGRLRDMEIAPA